jgi:hypothetical protein
VGVLLCAAGVSGGVGPVTLLLQAEDDVSENGNKVMVPKPKKRVLSLDELAVLMGYTCGEKIVAITYRADEGLVVLSEPTMKKDEE